MTLYLVIFTSLISIIGFANRNIFEKLEFNPNRVYYKKEYYRLITHAFLHADWIHLIVNMIVLYSFGQGLEYYLNMRIGDLFGISTNVYYLFIYFSAIVVSALTTLKKYRDIPVYNAVGASGAISTIVFSCIFFDPWRKLGVFFIIPIPGILFGIIYLLYSNYMSKRSNDNINHDAHFLGALYGFTFPILLNPSLFYDFLKQLIHFQL